MKFIESRNPLHSYSDEKFIFRRQIYFSKEKRKIEKTTKRIEQNKGSKGPIKARRYVFTIFSSKSRTSYIFFSLSLVPVSVDPRKRFRLFIGSHRARDLLFFLLLVLPSPSPLLFRATWRKRERGPRTKGRPSLISGRIKPRRSKLALHNGGAKTEFSVSRTKGIIDVENRNRSKLPAIVCFIFFFFHCYPSPRLSLCFSLSFSFSFLFYFISLSLSLSLISLFIDERNPLRIFIR